MSRRSKVTVNERAVEALKGLAEVGDDLEQRAEPVLDEARATAPVKTGDYRDKLRIDRAVVDGVQVVRVLSDSDHAVFVEAEHGTLNRALDAAGRG